MKKIQLFILIGLSFLVSGCIFAWRGGADPCRVSRHVVTKYSIEPWEPVTKGMFRPLEDPYWEYYHLMKISYCAGGDAWIPIDHVIEMQIPLPRYSYVTSNYFITDNSMVDAYNELCRKHGDTKRSPIGSPFCDAAYFHKDMKTFAVTSTEDFDPQHPAGSSLLDILHFAANSPYRILKNNYRMTFDEDVLLYNPEECPYGRLDFSWNDYMGAASDVGQVFNTYKRGDRVGKDDLTILGGFFIVFDKLPDPVGPRTIQVRLTDEYGKVYDYEVQMSFATSPGFPTSL